MIRVRIVKAKKLSKKKKIFLQLFAVLLALVLTGIFILFMGHNPIEVYVSMVSGSFGTGHRISETIVKTIPLVIAGLGIGVAFKMKFWNIGGEGQMLMGGFGAALIALNFTNLPGVLLMPIMIIVGILFGGIWALIAGILKAKFKTNETIITLMLNYIALKWITYLQYQRWKDPASLGFPKIANFGDNAILPKLFGIHIGWIIALVLVIAVHVFLNYTKKGYEISVLGESENTAKYAGMNVKKLILLTTFISGGLVGLAGAIQASAVANTLSIQLTSNVGNTAIIVSWLSGLNATWTLVVSVAFAVLIQGASYIQTAFQIPQAAADIIQSTILFCVLGCQFFLQYRMVFEFSAKTKMETNMTERGETYGN
ncbi:ABC transporter permease [Clostridium diolis]|uniref:ABC transporter permease n=1 Tax=Clostridium diolis TaxID=223919 RepID=A0AAV3W280_9CLOT|nr:ABC transporter permease [Clostridium diolis]QES71775.1 ABC transporter permease [Clostridium diolis]GEA31114.1 ABC transporter permease [Clostridium diolis]